MKKTEILSLILASLILLLGAFLLVSTVSNSSEQIKEKVQSQKPTFSAKKVTIIGDSITFLSKKTLIKNIDGLKSKNIDAVGGRTWQQAIEVAKNIKLQPTVVFALGTNSPNLSETEIEDAINVIGNNKKIIFVTNYTLENDYRGNNSLLRNYAKNYENIYLADWEKAVKDNAEKYLTPDPIHPNKDGMKLFSKIIKRSLEKALQ